MQLLTGFEAFGPPVKDFAVAVSVVILDGASIVQMLKVLGLALFSEQNTKDVLKRYVISTFCAVGRVD